MVFYTTVLFSIFSTLYLFETSSPFFSVVVKLVVTLSDVFALCKKFDGDYIIVNNDKRISFNAIGFLMVIFNILNVIHCGLFLY